MLSFFLSQPEIFALIPVRVILLCEYETLCGPTKKTSHFGSSKVFFPVFLLHSGNSMGSNWTREMLHHNNAGSKPEGFDMILPKTSKTYHQPGFPWNGREFPFQQLPFGGFGHGRLIWPDWLVPISNFVASSLVPSHPSGRHKSNLSPPRLDAPGYLALQDFGLFVQPESLRLPID